MLFKVQWLQWLSMTILASFSLFIRAINFRREVRRGFLSDLGNRGPQGVAIFLHIVNH